MVEAVDGVLEGGEGVRGRPQDREVMPRAGVDRRWHEGHLGVDRSGHGRDVEVEPHYLTLGGDGLQQRSGEGAEGAHLASVRDDRRPVALALPRLVLGVRHREGEPRAAQGGGDVLHCALDGAEVVLEAQTAALGAAHPGQHRPLLASVVARRMVGATELEEPELLPMRAVGPNQGEQVGHQRGAHAALVLGGGVGQIQGRAGIEADAGQPVVVHRSTSSTMSSGMEMSFSLRWGGIPTCRPPFFASARKPRDSRMATTLGSGMCSPTFRSRKPGAISSSRKLSLRSPS